MAPITKNPYDYPDEKWHEEVSENLFRGRARREAARILKQEEFPTPEFPEMLDLRTRLLRPRTETTFRIEGWQPSNGRVVLAAQYKAGKTSMVGNLVRCLLDGSDFLDVAPVRKVQGRVSILDFEMSEHTIEDWLEKQGIRHDDRLDLTVIRGKGQTFNILDPIVRREWAARLAEREVDYLVLDCLRPALDALGLNEHTDAGKFLGPFDALLDEAGVSEAMVVHHMGHFGERGRGDSRIRDWPDVEWRLMRENDHPNSTRYITAFGRDVEVPEMKLDFDKDTKRLSASGGSRTDLDADNALVAVLHVLGDQGEAISGRIIEGLLKDSEHVRTAIRGALKLGVRRELIVMKGGARGATLYELPARSWVASRFGGGEGAE